MPGRSARTRRTSVWVAEIGVASLHVSSSRPLPGPPAARDDPHRGERELGLPEGRRAGKGDTGSLADEHVVL